MAASMASQVFPILVTRPMPVPMFCALRKIVQDTVFSCTGIYLLAIHDYWTCYERFRFHLVGWGNQELQVYQPQNAEVAGGVLGIRADVAPGVGYVSARLAGAAGRAFAPGPGETLRIEARIQLPRGDHWSSF